MRRVLSRLGARGTVALGLCLVVLSVVGLGRLVAGGTPAARYPSAPRPPATVDPTAGDDAAVAPPPSNYPDEAIVLDTAADFAAAWLRRELTAETWHAGIAEFATPSLARSLAGVDPLGVPARRMLGAPTLVLRAEGYAQVMIAVDTGILSLSLVRRGGRWRVDGVDWDRA